ncbi:MAG TPA: HAMP domain-containing sensor histidine kinase [Candidatus Binatus sp.]|nr:HAMP domain-containing sensor histidine kinase [Candidatus Binatus sp.]
MKAHERRSPASRIPDLTALSPALRELARSKHAVPLLYLELTGIERLNARSRERTLAACKREVAAALRVAAGSVLRRRDAVACGHGARWFVALLVGRSVAARARSSVSDAELGLVAARLAASVRARLKSLTAAARDIGVIAGWTVLDPVSDVRPLDDLRQAIRGAAVVARIEAQRALVLAAVTHELRTPLMSIIGYAERLRDEPGRAAGARSRDAAIVVQEAGRLRRLVETLIDAGAWTAGKLALDRSPRAIAPIVRSAWKALPSRPREARPRLKVRGDARVAVDRERLEQVFINLLDNAVRHSPASGTVLATIDESAGGCVVAVVDQGSGFSKRAARSLGAPFASGSDGRAGLGLSIARLLVEAHGGTLALRERRGGARIEVRLPQC